MTTANAYGKDLSTVGKIGTLLVALALAATAFQVPETAFADELAAADLNVAALTANESAQALSTVAPDRQFKITYNCHGGKNATSNPKVYKTSDKARKLAAPTRAGYTFTGWRIGSTNGKKVTSIPAGSRGNITLHAKWTVVNYGVTNGKENTRGQRISTLTKRYASHSNGGVALVGTSYMSRWNVAVTFDKLGFGADKVYNFAIGGDSPVGQCADSKYIKMVADKKPQVVIVNGVNDLNRDSRNASKNNSIAQNCAKATDQMVEKLRAELKKRGVKDARFIIIGSLKTPKRYGTSLNANEFSANRGPKTCNYWKRVDTYNKCVAAYANNHKDVEYYDLGKDFYKTDAKGNLNYYLNKADRTKGIAKGQAWKLYFGKQTNSYLGVDANDRGHHPTEKAYQDIFPKVAKRALKAIGK